jgi:hypothetical protein
MEVKFYFITFIVEWLGAIALRPSVNIVIKTLENGNQKFNFLMENQWGNRSGRFLTKLFIVKKLLSDGDANRKSNPPLDWLSIVRSDDSMQTAYNIIQCINISP